MLPKRIHLSALHQKLWRPSKRHRGNSLRPRSLPSLEIALRVQAEQFSLRSERQSVAQVLVGALSKMGLCFDTIYPKRDVD
jgi:hypothetical protein